MKKSKLILLTLLSFSLALFLSGCGFTNQPPNASFSVSSPVANMPQHKGFDASGSSDPDGQIVSYDWELGDGSTKTGKTVTHSYDSAGSYTVELTVVDDDGAIDEATKTIEIEST